MEYSKRDAEQFEHVRQEGEERHSGRKKKSMKYLASCPKEQKEMTSKEKKCMFFEQIFIYDYTLKWYSNQKQVGETKRVDYHFLLFCLLSFVIKGPEVLFFFTAVDFDFPAVFFVFPLVSDRSVIILLLLASKSLSK